MPTHKAGQTAYDFEPVIVATSPVDYHENQLDFYRMKEPETGSVFRTTFP